MAKLPFPAGRSCAVISGLGLSLTFGLAAPATAATLDVDGYHVTVTRQIETTGNPAGGGTVKTTTSGQTLNLEAKAAKDFTFSYWLASDSLAGYNGQREPSLSVNVTGPGSLVAVFRPDGSHLGMPSADHFVATGGSWDIYRGTEVTTLMATANHCFVFDHWEFGTQPTVLAGSRNSVTVNFAAASTGSLSPSPVFTALTTGACAPVTIPDPIYVDVVLPDVYLPDANGVPDPNTGSGSGAGNGAGAGSGQGSNPGTGTGSGAGTGTGTGNGDGTGVSGNSNRSNGNGASGLNGTGTSGSNETPNSSGLPGQNGQPGSPGTSGTTPGSGGNTPGSNGATPGSNGTNPGSSGLTPNSSANPNASGQPGTSGPNANSPAELPLLTTGNENELPLLNTGEGEAAPELPNTGHSAPFDEGATAAWKTPTTLLTVLAALCALLTVLLARHRRQN